MRARRRVFSCRLQRGKPNTFLLTPGARGRSRPACYELSGWLELDYVPHKGGGGSFSVKLMNLSGICVSEGQPAGLPRFIHATLSAPQEAPRPIAKGQSRGTLQLALAVDYPELGAIPAHLGDPSSHGLPSILPIMSTLELTYVLDISKRTFRASGVAPLPECPPLSKSLTPLFFDITCTIAEETACKQVCLDIKLAPLDVFDSATLLNTEGVEDIIREVNRIWGCGVPGQCCIRFKIDRIIVPLKPALKRVVLLEHGDCSDDFMETVNIDRARDPKCYNLYFVDEITVPAGEAGIGGQTAYGKDADGRERSGSIVRSDESNASTARTVAHELGHAMGLAAGAANDPAGVTGHTANPDNLMANVTPPGLNRLNAAQCAEARKSALLTDTQSRCNLAPDE